MDSAETLQQTVARNVREYRRARGLTLEALATAADVSRRMLILIERGATNPSIATLDRLGQALGIGFPALVGLPSATLEAQVIAPAEMPIVWQGTHPGSVAQLTVALGPRGGVEMWQWQLAAGETFVANADPSGTQKLFYVLDGVLTLRFNGGDLRVPAGYGARLPGDRPHNYENRDTDPVRFLCTIVLGDIGMNES